MKFYLVVLLLSISTCGRVPANRHSPPVVLKTAANPPLQSDTLHPVIPKKYQGLWVNETFAEVLSATRSPKIALKQSGIPFCYVGERTLWYGIHEATLDTVLSIQQVTDTNKVCVLMRRDIDTTGWGFPATDLQWDSTECVFSSFPSDSGRLMMWQGDRLFHVQDDSIEHFVNAVTIAGNYTDSLGRSYKFTSTGEAFWPAKRFRYEVLLDFTFGDPNTIFNPNQLDTTSAFGYGFDFKGDKLLLYHVTSDLPVEEDSIPFLMLHRKDADHN